MTLVGWRLNRELLSVVDIACNHASLYLMAACPTSSNSWLHELQAVGVTDALHRGSKVNDDWTMEQRAKLESQVASKAEDDSGVRVWHTAINDLQIRCDLEPGGYGDVVEDLDACSVVRIEEGA